MSNSPLVTLAKAALAAAALLFTHGAAAQTLYFLHADHLNTPRLLTDQNQAVVWRWDPTEPFGNSVGVGSMGRDGFVVTVPLRYPGQYFDKETNLNYNYFRDYDPAIGRYVQSDLIGLNGGVNTYTYVDSVGIPLGPELNTYRYARGNPLSFVDPEGLDATTWNNTSGGRNRWDGPTNGNWGGKCWSGGQYSCGPGRSPGNAPPTDSGDACYQRHDNCYVKCGGNEMCIAACNQTLVGELQRLDNDPRRWPQPPRPGTEGDSRRYRDAAIRYFR